MIISPVEPGLTPGSGQRTTGHSYRSHVAALALVVALLSLFVGTDSSWSGDEGAALHQARILVEHDRWGLPSTLPAVDPEGDWFPIRHSWPVESGMAPLAKRPLYPVLVSVGWLVSPKWGPVAVSVLGAVVAAAASGLIARRIRPALDRPTLWVAGLGSPLLFDSQIVIAHTLGAAAVTLAVLNALRFFDHHRRLDLAGVFAFVTLAGLVRSEAVLAALALALAAPIATRFTRAGRQVGVVALAAAGAAWMLERFTLGLIGVRVAPLVPGGSGAGWVADRWTGFWATWFQPGYRDDPLELMLVGAVVLMAVAVVLARKRAGVELVTALVGAAAGLILARLLLGGGATVPGIVWAFPLAPLGVMAQKRAHLDDLTVRFVLITAALFAGAVLATQYPTGGTWEWGWRYFAIAVGLVVPVAISALDELVSVYPAPARRRLVLTGVAGMVGLVGLMLSALRITHVAHAMMVDDVVTQIAAVEPSDGGTPVMVTTVTQIGRLAWQERPDDRWLLVDEDELFEAVDAVRASSVGRFAVLVDAELGTALLARGITVEDEVELWGGYAFLVVAG